MCASTRLNAVGQAFREDITSAGGGVSNECTVCEHTADFPGAPLSGDLAAIHSWSTNCCGCRIRYGDTKKRVGTGIHLLISFYVAVVEGTPFLLIIFIIYYIFPYFGYTLTPF